jgi:hypothetical protein
VTKTGPTRTFARPSRPRRPSGRRCGGWWSRRTRTASTFGAAGRSSEATGACGTSRSRSSPTVADPESPASAVVDAVAGREGVDPTDLPPLYDSVAPGVLESVGRSDDERGQTVTFEYHGYTVTLDADGTVVVE